MPRTVSGSGGSEVVVLVGAPPSCVRSCRRAIRTILNALVIPSGIRAAPTTIREWAPVAVMTTERALERHEDAIRIAVDFIGSELVLVPTFDLPLAQLELQVARRLRQAMGSVVVAPRDDRLGS